jgi:hypothetical protein
MKYRLGDTAPDLEWELNQDLTGADVTATYTKPNGEVTASVCTVIVENPGTDQVKSRIQFSWFEDDLNVLGIGKIQLRWTSGLETGTIHPVNGWNITVVP